MISVADELRRPASSQSTISDAGGMKIIVKKNYLPTNVQVYISINTCILHNKIISQTAEEERITAKSIST